MRVLIVGILVLALAVAGVSTYLIKTFSGEENIEELEKKAKKKKFKVLVAKKSLKIGEKVIAGAIGWQEWAEEALNPEFVVVEEEEQEGERIKEFVGSIVRHTITQNEPILTNKLFKRDAPGFMAGMLGPGMRAVSVSVSATSGASGFIFPGDYVDVISSSKPDKDSKKELKKLVELGAIPPVGNTFVEVVLRKVRVIAVNSQVSEFETKESKTIAAKTVTLEVTPKQAEIIFVAIQKGKLSLALRSLEDPDGEPAPLSFTTEHQASPLSQFIYDTTKNFIKQQEELAQRQAMEAARAASESAAAGAAPKKARKPVKIYLGGSGTTQTVGGGDETGAAAK
ncbi:MAG: Flp pilus assembly protein CpaB [Rhodospirillales bacterium]